MGYTSNHSKAEVLGKVAHVTCATNMHTRWNHRMVVFACLFLYAFTTIAQNAAEDFKKISEKYKGNKFNMQIMYLLFPDYTSTSSIEKKQFSISKWEHQASTKTEGITIIRNDQYSLYVNSKQKIMMLNPVYKEAMQEQEAEMQSLFNPDSLLKFYKKVEMIKDAPNSRTYRLHYDEKSRYAYMDITFNKQTFLMEKTVMYYSHSLKELTGMSPQGTSPAAMPRLEVIYTRQEFPLKKNEILFSMSTYFSTNKGKHVPKGAYATYEFVDYTTQTK